MNSPKYPLGRVIFTSCTFPIRLAMFSRKGLFFSTTSGSLWIWHHVSSRSNLTFSGFVKPSYSASRRTNPLKSKQWNCTKNRFGLILLHTTTWARFHATLISAIKALWLKLFSVNKLARVSYLGFSSVASTSCSQMRSSISSSCRCNLSRNLLGSSSPIPREPDPSAELAIAPELSWSVFKAPKPCHPSHQPRPKISLRGDEGASESGGSLSIVVPDMGTHNGVPLGGLENPRSKP